MNKRFQKVCIWIMVAYVVIAAGFYAIAHKQLREDDWDTSMLSTSSFVGEITQDTHIWQRLDVDGDQILSVSIRFTTLGRQNTSHLYVGIHDSNGQIPYETVVDCAEIEEQMIMPFYPQEPIDIQPGVDYYLVVSSPDGQDGNAVSILIGNSVATARTDVPLQIADADKVTVNGEPLDAKLCYRLGLRRHLLFGEIYGWLAAGVGVLLAGYLLYMCSLVKQGKKNFMLNLVDTTKKYEFLIRQLVMRDFKSRYKRSILGVFWSFLNPLLTLLVQYVVFSTIFRADIEKYPLYLLIGIVIFNFFNEATSVASQAIVSNTHLITKVYIPKIIYPLCSVLVAGLNLVISFIPMLGVMALTQAPLTPAFLLVVFNLICLMCFCIGVGLILATGMVYFKDVQFLWNVLTTLWMYATPIFYPESIIPAQLMPIYRLNPLYRFIGFFRTIMIEGVSPAPSAYLACILCAVIPLAVGLFVFFKRQDDFIFHL